MGLMQLLKVGQSLSEARDRPNRYRLKSGALPVFGLSGEDAVNDLDNQVVQSPLVQGETTKPAAEVGHMMNETTATKMDSKPARRAVFGRHWASRVNPFRVSKTLPIKQSVQGELVLDKVKPVRNDLTDSDLELVAASKLSLAAPKTVKIGLVEVQVVKLGSFWTRCRELLKRGS